MTTTSAFDTTLNSLGINRANAPAKVQDAKSADTLTTGDFIKLLTAQLNNQDPTQPTDAAQQLTQLAQFSQVSGLNDVNTTLKSIQDKLSKTSASDALAYVGHSVLTEGSTAYARNSGGIAGAVELGSAATDVRISIQSADGRPLKSLSLGPQPAGTVAFDWDGRTDSGADAGNGPFTVTAVANDGGTTVDSRTLVWAPVSSVSVPATGNPVLTLPGIGQVDTSKVRQIG